MFHRSQRDLAVTASKSTDRFLVTGGLGCIGAWVVRQLLVEGCCVHIGDVGGSTHRLDQLVAPDADGLSASALDITDRDDVARCFDAFRPTHVIHLAALQVPFCKVDPILGARVNVVGTVVLMEEMADRLPHGTFAYASSVAAYGENDDGDDSNSAGPTGKPGTLYGVYKRANEDSATVYFRDRGLQSVGLRPYVVYGVGRDQGVTSAPTAAMRAAAAGEEFHISFGGRAMYHHAHDAACAFIAAARSQPQLAAVVNMPGDEASMGDVIDAIRARVPDAAITYDDVQLPFPEAVDTSHFERVVGRLDRYSLVNGVAETIDRFQALKKDGAV